MKQQKKSFDQPRVGVGVIVLRGDLVLIGQRIGSHGSGTWNFPGGHLELNEDVFECARREAREETGLEISGLQHGPHTNDVFVDEGKHYVTLFVIAHCEVGEPVVKEPNKCREWRWVKWQELSRPMFLPLENLVKSGFSPWS